MGAEISLYELKHLVTLFYFPKLSFEYIVLNNNNSMGYKSKKSWQSRSSVKSHSG
jgi:hypothetical protein